MRITTKTGWTPERVMKLRRAMGLTQQEFSQYVGTTVATVNRWERGRKKVSRLSALRLDQVLEAAKVLARSKAIPKVAS